MSKIQLTLVNKSDSSTVPEVVVVQKNEIALVNGKVHAWHVFRNLAKAQRVRFTCITNFTMACVDSWGNYTPQCAVVQGKSYSISRAESGYSLKAAGAAFTANEFDFKNELPEGAINALVYNDGIQVASVSAILPGQKIRFLFNTELYIGVASELVRPGEELNDITLSELGTLLVLTGMRSADIVMTGGGHGPTAKPYKFMLENIVYV